MLPDLASSLTLWKSYHVRIFFVLSQNFCAKNQANVTLAYYKVYQVAVEDFDLVLLGIYEKVKKILT